MVNDLLLVSCTDVYDKEQNNYWYQKQTWARRVARYFTAITQDQKLTTFYTTVANIESLKHMVPDAFIVFSRFDMASRGDQTFLTITYARGK